jgi:hypothetical protein
MWRSRDGGTWSASEGFPFNILYCVIRPFALSARQTLWPNSSRSSRHHSALLRACGLALRTLQGLDVTWPRLKQQLLQRMTFVQTALDFRHKVFGNVNGKMAPSLARKEPNSRAVYQTGRLGNSLGYMERGASSSPCFTSPVQERLVAPTSSAVSSGRSSTWRSM